MNSKQVKTLTDNATHTHLCPRCGRRIRCSDDRCKYDPEVYTDGNIQYMCGCRPETWDMPPTKSKIEWLRED